MTSTPTTGKQHWYLRFFMNPLLLALRSIVMSSDQLLSKVPSSSGQQHWYVEFVFNPLVGLLKSIGAFFVQVLKIVGYILEMLKNILVMLQRFIVSPILRSPSFIIVFVGQLLRFHPNQLTPGRYAIKTVGKWPRRFMAFFPALFHFFVAWGEQRPRLLNRITLLAPVSASLSLFSLTILKASFLASFLELHFPEGLNTDVIKLPPL